MTGDRRVDKDAVAYRALKQGLGTAAERAWAPEEDRPVPVSALPLSTGSAQITKPYRTSVSISV